VGESPPIGDSGDADAIVWSGAIDEAFADRVASAGVPVVALVGSDTAPAAALDAGATDVVRRGPDAERVLARRLESVLAAGATTDGGARLDTRYRAILDQVDDPVFLKDREGRYEYVNERAAALFGASVDDIVGATDVDLFGAETGQEIRAVDREVLETGEAKTVEHTIEDGEAERAFETVIQPFEREGEVTGVVGVARDVTERRGAERQLQRNERALGAATRRPGRPLADSDARRGAGHRPRPPRPPAGLLHPYRGRHRDHRRVGR
jgi:PAS domain S-box-containing protein